MHKIFTRLTMTSTKLLTWTPGKRGYKVDPSNFPDALICIPLTCNLGLVLDGGWSWSVGVPWRCCNVGVAGWSVRAIRGTPWATSGVLSLEGRFEPKHWWDNNHYANKYM